MVFCVAAWLIRVTQKILRIQFENGFFPWGGLESFSLLAQIFGWICQVVPVKAWETLLRDLMNRSHCDAFQKSRRWWSNDSLSVAVRGSTGDRVWVQFHGLVFLFSTTSFQPRHCFIATKVLKLTFPIRGRTSHKSFQCNILPHARFMRDSDYVAAKISNVQTRKLGRMFTSHTFTILGARYVQNFVWVPPTNPTWSSDHGSDRIADLTWKETIAWMLLWC